MHVPLRDDDAGVAGDLLYGKRIGTGFPWSGKHGVTQGIENERLYVGVLQNLRVLAFQTV